MQLQAVICARVRVSTCQPAAICRVLSFTQIKSFFYNKKRALFVFFVDYPEEARSQQLEMPNKGH